MAKQQGIGLQATVQQFERFAGAARIEQEIGVGAERVVVGGIQCKGVAEMRFRFVAQAGARCHFGKDRQHPAAHLGLRLRRAGKYRLQRLVAFAQTAAGAGHPIGTGGPDEFRRKTPQCRAFRECLGKRAPDLQYRRTGQARLAVARIGLEQDGQVRQSRVKIVHPLAQRGAQQ